MRMLVVALSVAAVTPAHAATPQMPSELVGQWCRVEGSKFVRAKNFCRADRSIVIIVHKYGFFIKNLRARYRMMCVPLEIDYGSDGWTVTTACGADDNSTPIEKGEFTFESGSDPNKMSIVYK